MIKDFLQAATNCNQEKVEAQKDLAM